MSSISGPVRANRVIGADVRNLANEDLGEIDDGHRRPQRRQHRLRHRRAWRASWAWARICWPFRGRSFKVTDERDVFHRQRIGRRLRRGAAVSAERVEENGRGRMAREEQRLLRPPRQIGDASWCLPFSGAKRAEIGRQGRRSEGAPGSRSLLNTVKGARTLGRIASGSSTCRGGLPGRTPRQCRPAITPGPCMLQRETAS